MANPLGGDVVAGEAQITAPDPATLIINQTTDKAVIEWESFNIGVTDTTRFVQPSSSSWTLNRVTGAAEPSQILGTLQSNGNLAIVNPDGILFGRNARVDVGGLIATTHDIANDDFMAGRFNFNQPGNPAASIVNEGSISISDYGLAAFVAPAVRNSGAITARLGRVALASGNEFTLDLYGDGLINLTVGDEILNDVVDVATGETVKDLVKNEGTISADGGTVALKAVTARQAVNSVVNNTGVIEANSVGMRGGKIVLGAQTAGTKSAGAPIQRVKVSGQLLAENVPVPTPRPDAGTGGHITVTGEMIEVADATIDASGQGGGGTILIGGDYMGGNGDPATIAEYGIQLEAEAIPTAAFVSLDNQSVLSTDAFGFGNGGKVIVWSDEATLTAATITARGGAEGNGGFVETSGKYLDAIGLVDASARNGKSGTWLLDPLNISISDSSSKNYGWYSGYLFTSRSSGVDYYGIGTYPTATSSNINTADIETVLNTGTNVRVSTWGTTGSGQGNIYLKDDIRKSSGGWARLQLSSMNDIYVSSNVDVRSTSGRLDFELWAPQGAIYGSNVGRIDTNGGFMHMEARDGIDFHSRYDIPDTLSVGLNWIPPTSPRRVDVDVSFDDDQIRFWHDGDTVTVPGGGVKLIDATATGNAYATLYGLNVLLEDRAFQFSGSRNWDVFIDPSKFVAVPSRYALNGVPEIILDQLFQFGQYSQPPGRYNAVPVLEVSYTGQPYVSEVIFTHSSGRNQLAQDVATDMITPTALNLKDENNVWDSSLCMLRSCNKEIVSLDFRADSADIWSGELTKKEAALGLLPYALLSDAAYADVNAVNGWIRRKTWEDVLRDGFSGSGILGRAQAEIAILAIRASGFAATIYEKDGKYVLAFRGTDSDIDWATNFPQIAGVRSNQYNLASIISNFVIGEVGAENLTLTGHSLGGGLAQYVSSQTPNLRAVTFNAAGIGKGENISSGLQNVVNARLSGDYFVSNFGRQLGSTKYTFENPTWASGLRPISNHKIGSFIRALQVASQDSF